MSKDLNFESLGTPEYSSPGSYNGKDCMYDYWYLCTIAAPEDDFPLVYIEYIPELVKYVVVISRKQKKV